MHHFLSANGALNQALEMLEAALEVCRAGFSRDENDEALALINAVRLHVEEALAFVSHAEVWLLQTERDPE